MKPEGLPTFINALMNPSVYDHPVDRFEVVQTHISWVVLTGDFAYKIKKPLDLGFLDFSTLEKRHFCCQEELRLNKRLAPQLYIDVVSITGTKDAPVLNGPGPVIEYAVKMKQFRQENQLDRVLARGKLTRGLIDTLARELADFHTKIKVADSDVPFGSPDQISLPVQANFGAIRNQISDQDERKTLDGLQEWTNQKHKEQLDDFRARKQGGFIRECHGDMHLANMVLFDDQVVIFDCIEFNEDLRWIDVMSETAFLVMDLEDRGFPEFSHRILNAYLELTGDYGGLKLLRYYQVYRALVRAKVACIRMGQPGLAVHDRERIREQYHVYEDLAVSYTLPSRPWLAIMHGLSGSGKSTVAQQVLEKTGAIRIRTDVERKRLFGLAPTARSDSGIDSGLYTQEATRETYRKMAALAALVLEAGFSVIADGAYLKKEERDVLRAVAERAKVPFVILDVQAPEETLVRRIEERQRNEGEVSEANLAVLKFLMAKSEPLDENERSFALEVKTDPDIPIDQILKTLKKIGRG